MKRFFNLCRRQRERLSLLASGALPDAERATTEAHLAACAECRRYFEEVRAVSRGLQSWRDTAPPVEPRPAWHAEWVRAIQPGHEPMKPRAETSLPWWQALFAGRRAALGGLGATWLLILFFRATAPEVAQPASQALLPAPRAVLMALKARDPWSEQRVPAPESDDESAPAQRPPKSPPPRSERGANHFIG
ncbi:MAG: zf-HC2 domain-containing protein [Verrucomicrobia bacterium]|nr:zf-HC2 domain-containing protein [Verrucomicrobiota bacterium]